MEPGLEAINYYDPPNFTFPFGAYICVMDVDVDTGSSKVRRFYALDDCGTRINPMIIEGQIHGGLTEAFGIAIGQEIHSPTRTATRPPRHRWTISCRPPSRPRNGRPTGPTTPSPHHPIGAEGVGESPERGRRAAPFQRGKRRFCILGFDRHRDAARQPAHVDGSRQTRSASVEVRQGRHLRRRSDPGAACLYNGGA